MIIQTLLINIKSIHNLTFGLHKFKYIYIYMYGFFCWYNTMNICNHYSEIDFWVKIDII